MNEMQNMPTRKPMCHRPPLGVDTAADFYFVTICARDRAGDPLMPVAERIVDSARYMNEIGKWFVALLLVMPDHIHMLVHFPPDADLAKVIGGWKRYLTRECNLKFQANFFDTRIRNDEQFAEKWDYIVYNPVAKGLVETPDAWPFVVAFERMGRVI